jgi:hypothetical protein
MSVAVFGGTTTSMRRLGIGNPALDWRRGLAETEVAVTCIC